MPRFFVNTITNPTCIIGQDATHIALSLRMKVGENITVCDGVGKEAIGVITAIARDMVTVEIGDIIQSESEAKTKITLYIGWPKGEKADLQVQKAVELGAYEIVFVVTSRCISRPNEKDAAKKMERLQKISREAASQSSRGIIPNVRGIISLNDAILEMGKFDGAFLLYEQTCPSLRSQLKENYSTIALFTGCEGGFDPKEVEKATMGGVSPASLGKRILRCETASIACLSGILFYLNEME